MTQIKACSHWLSARDLISIFIALELLSIPAYMMAAWRKRDNRSNEAGMKYYLMGVFASAVLLYGMSFLYGFTGSTQLTGLFVIGVATGPEDTVWSYVYSQLPSFAPMATAVVFAMLASYFLSRTLVPTMVLFLLPIPMSASSMAADLMPT